MEIILGLLGLGGLSLLLQSKPLPTKDEAIKASEKLNENPNDPAANLVAGKYLAFVMGKYDEAMGYLIKSSDSTLKNLAEHEIDPAYTDSPDKQVAIGNEWVKAAGKFPALVGLFYDRASHWYIKAWYALKEPDKAKLRIQARRLAAPRRPGVKRKGIPSGWEAAAGIAAIKDPELDNTIARTGSYSVKNFPPNETVPNGYSNVRSILYPIKGNPFEASAFVRSEGTDNPSDRFLVDFYDNRGTFIGDRRVPIPTDMPFWNHVVINGDVVPGASYAILLVRMYSKKGNIWVDDASLKFNGIEDLKNGSFEEK